MHVVAVLQKAGSSEIQSVEELTCTMQPPATAYKPGTFLTVGSHRVVIEKYLSQGGFADVYTCKMTPAWGDNTVGCLKRVAVPNKPSLNLLRQEVDAMRRLRGRRYIVSYIDSHACHAENGQGYVVFLLMEYCSRNGLIDLMNTRLVNKLTEPEILEIMGDITEAVACMHSLEPSLVHRDIKIENVLISGDGKYKLCDFGSASPPLPPAQDVEDFQRLQDDILHHTTPQYRSPEMIDLYRRQPIDEKSDIWALGIMLYKLCYYTTPFEKNAINGAGNAGGGNYAILNGLYSFPSSPPYSARLKNLIAKTLMVNPGARPDVFQLLEEICKMRGTHYPDLRSKGHPVQKHQLYTATGPAAADLTLQPVSSDPFSGIQKYHTGRSNSRNGSAEFQRNASSHSIPQTIVRHPSVEGIRLSSSVKKRPLSMSATEFGRLTGERLRNEVTSPIQSIITGMTEEEIVELSPNHHTNIDSSVEFLRDISRQSTNSSLSEPKSKRSSISSLKDLLTGGRFGARRHTSHQSLKSVSSRKSSGHLDSSESLLDFAHFNRHDQSSAASVSPLVPPTRPPKRSNSIQKRVKMLLSRKPSPPPKTASGYGKYTEPSKGHIKHPTLLPPATAIAIKKVSVSKAAPQTKAHSAISPSLVKEADPFSRKQETSPQLSHSLQVPQIAKFHERIHKKKPRTPPPKPKKPTYLRSPKLKSEEFLEKDKLYPSRAHQRDSSEDSTSLYDEDYEVLERRFEERYPSAI
ncbi:DEKNAAC101283 [Brettanomyces naardenensis]|uniref:non-specific serine/threonine protein kinase n=1 Tax=Brettanomyces naardenensis TaxID=13370 RepID=A0A448YI04_BRENA|nr:DEKNAAC101283 [Brettanomyces naardenensis]